MVIKKHNSTSGLLSLEASITLTIFIFLMLFLYSFFVVFEARNAIGHALLTTSDSLSLDALANEAAEDESTQEFMLGLLGAVNNDAFSQTSKWYSGENAEIQETISNRFIAYLAGGDQVEADKILKSLNVVNGISGLDFSESKVLDNNLFLVVRYKLDYEFKVFGLGSIEFEQKCCSKLWNGQTSNFKQSSESATDVGSGGGRF